MKRKFPHAPDMSLPDEQLLFPRVRRSRERKARIKETGLKISDASKVYLQIVSGALRKAERAKLKKEIIVGYGGKCACCGESEPAFLTIDHIHRDGKSDREMFGSHTFYQHLKANGFPIDRYRLYCMNCNWGSRLTGKCPHVKRAPRHTTHGEGYLE